MWKLDPRQNGDNKCAKIGVRAVAKPEEKAREMSLRASMETMK